MKNKILLLLSIILMNTPYSYGYDNKIDPAKHVIKDQKRRPNIKNMAIGVTKATIAIKQNPFSEDGIWDQTYLARDEEVANIIKQFMEGTYAESIKKINTEQQNKDQIISQLINLGFKKREAEGRVDGMFGRSKDREFQDAGEIFVHEDGSMVRIKDYSAKRSFRPQAYVVLAALKNKTGPVTWQNEAFKISKEGFPVPKGPKQSHGLKIHAPNSSGADEDRGWVDLIMEEVHIDLIQ